MKQYLAQMLDDPAAAHAKIRKDGRFRDLCKFVRSLAMRYRMVLAINPTTYYTLRNWQLVAAILRGELVVGPGGPSGSSGGKGLWEVDVHFRSAHVWESKHGLRVRSGSLVRADKLKPQDRMALSRLLADYNRWAKGSRETPLESLGSWMRRQGVVLRGAEIAQPAGDQIHVQV